jgi:hypothetical protein
MKHLVVGMLLVAGGLWGMFSWWATFGMVMRGVLPFFALTFGMLALLSSYYRLSESDVPFDEEDEEMR